MRGGVITPPRAEVRMQIGTVTPPGQRGGMEATLLCTDVSIEHTRSVEWNHGLGQTVTALLDHGLVVTDLLAPGGRLFMREGHPVLHALAEPLPGGLLAIEQSGTLASPVWSGYAMGTTCRHHCEGKPTHGVLTARTPL